MIRILLIRHGHVEGINPLRFRGRQDVPLTSQGKQEAIATGAYIARHWRPSAVYTSPMIRCVFTGQKIAAACGVESSICGELNDIDYGTWQWRTHEEVQLQWPEEFRDWFRIPHLIRFPEGDSLQDLVARTSDALRFVRQRHDGQTVVLVGHDSVNRAILLQLLDQPLSAYWRIAQGPCAVNEVEIDGTDIRVMRVNDLSHLSEVSGSRG